MLYNSMVLSRLNYSVIAWGYQPGGIIKLQKKALRIISGSKYNAHTEPICKHLHVLKFEHILELRILKFFYKLRNNQLPSYFENFNVRTNIEVHGYNTRSAGNISTNRTTRPCRK